MFVNYHQILITTRHEDPKSIWSAWTLPVTGCWTSWRVPGLPVPQLVPTSCVNACLWSCFCAIVWSMHWPSEKSHRSWVRVLAICPLQMCSLCSATSYQSWWQSPHWYHFPCWFHGWGYLSFIFPITLYWTLAANAFLVVPCFLSYLILIFRRHQYRKDRRKLSLDLRYQGSLHHSPHHIWRSQVQVVQNQEGPVRGPWCTLCRDSRWPYYPLPRPFD